MPYMNRKSALAIVTATVVAGIVAPNASAARPRVSATPKNVAFGHEQTISGHGWKRSANCATTVRLTINNGNVSHGLGTARVAANGTFTKRWTPRRGGIVTAGSWNMVVQLRCASGSDNTTVFARRSFPITIH